MSNNSSLVPRTNTKDLRNQATGSDLKPFST